MHMFRFFIDLLGWLVTQYKVSATNLVRSPIYGPWIRLWKANADGSPKLPTRVLSRVQFGAMMHLG
jgi:hypothetical protein